LCWIYRFGAGQPKIEPPGFDAAKFWQSSELAVTGSNQTKTHCHAERSEASAFAFLSFRIGGDTGVIRQRRLFETLQSMICSPAFYYIFQALVFRHRFW